MTEQQSFPRSIQPVLISPKEILRGLQSGICLVRLELQWFIQ